MHVPSSGTQKFMLRKSGVVKKLKKVSVLGEKHFLIKETCLHGIIAECGQKKLKV